MLSGSRLSRGFDYKGLPHIDKIVQMSQLGFVPIVRKKTLDWYSYTWSKAERCVVLLGDYPRKSSYMKRIDFLTTYASKELNDLHGHIVMGHPTKGLSALLNRFFSSSEKNHLQLYEHKMRVLVEAVEERCESIGVKVRNVDSAYLPHNLENAKV